MGDFILLSRDGGRDGNAPSGSSLPSIYSLASILKRARAQRNSLEQQQETNVTQRISSIATRLSDSLKARVNQSREERRTAQERHERQQILELRMANVGDLLDTTRLFAY